MAPKSKKSKNNRRSSSHTNLKKKAGSQNQSSESIVTNSVQSNSIENISNLNNKDSKSGSQTAIANIDLDLELKNILNDTQMVDNKPSNYEITTTYKTEMVECTVDPETGDIIEVITEIYVTDSLNLNKKEENNTNLAMPMDMPAIMDPTGNVDLDEVLRQLNMGTEICKDLLS